MSYGRRRRDADSEDLSANLAQNGRAIVWSDQAIINPRGTPPRDLETDILVFGPQPIVFPINLTSTETSNSVLTTSKYLNWIKILLKYWFWRFFTESFAEEEGPPLEGWCVTRAVFLGVLIGWILLQILLAIAIWTAATMYVEHTNNVRLRNVRWKDDSAFDWWVLWAKT